MSAFVVDASVAAKWYLPEPHSDTARRLLAGRHDLHAPEFLLLEIDNVLCSRIRRREIARRDADRSRDALFGAPMALHEVEPLRDGAYEMASRLRRSVYDCLYLALGHRLRCPVVTADQRLVNALAGGPVADLLLWVEDIP